MNGKNHCGFTLFELLITLVIIAILTTLATPDFGALIQRNRVASAASDIIASITYARSEAIRRGRAIMVCPAGTGLQDGWTIEAGPDGDFRTCGDASNTVLRQYDALAVSTVTTPPPVSDLLRSPLRINRLGVSNDGWGSSITFQATGCTAGAEGMRRTLTITQLLEVDSESSSCT